MVIFTPKKPATPTPEYVSREAGFPCWRIDGVDGWWPSEQAAVDAWRQSRATPTDSEVAAAKTQWDYIDLGSGSVFMFRRFLMTGSETPLTDNEIAHGIQADRIRQLEAEVEAAKAESRKAFSASRKAIEAALREHAAERDKIVAEASALDAELNSASVNLRNEERRANKLAADLASVRAENTVLRQQISYRPTDAKVDEMLWRHSREIDRLTDALAQSSEREGRLRDSLQRLRSELEMASVEWTEPFNATAYIDEALQEKGG
jgi:hypothetical protein